MNDFLSMRDWLAGMAMTVGGLGRLPRGRGTAGTAGAVALYWTARSTFSDHPGWLPGAGLAIAGFLVVALGRWSQARYSAHDPQEVVLDEVAGFFATVLGFQNLSVADLAVAFALFRFFDIVKPFPARHLERLPRGWGILADDLAAAAYANLCLRAWVRWGGMP